MSKGTLLFVDDEEKILEIARGIFSESYEVLTASSGEKALEVLEKHPVQVVLADQFMDGMSGTELLSWVNEHYPDTLRLLITGYPDLDDLAEAVNQGHIFGFIRKPWNITELRIRVKQALDHWRVQEENRRLTSELRKDNFSLHNIIRNLQSALLVVDKRSRICIMNPAAAALFDLKEEEVKGRGIDDFPILKPLYPVIQRTMERKTNYNYQEVEVRIGEQDVRHIGFGTTLVGFGSHPLYGEDSALQGVILLARDITEKKRMEEQLIHSEKLSAIGLLAGGVAHEIKNPLAVILGYSEMLLEGEHQDDSTVEALSKIQRQAKRCSDIVQNLLKFSRRSEVSIAPININQVLQETLDLLGKQLLVQNIKVETEFSSILPVYWGNENELQQVFFNLIVNAKDAMESGGTLTLRTTQEGEWLQIRISDTGCGIPKELQEKLFQPFFTTKVAGKGTGLGLSIVQNMIHKINGQIRLESSEGVGTTFTIELPRNEPGSAEDSGEDSEKKSGSQDSPVLKVMLVDDEEDIRSLCKEILINDDHEVVDFGCGLDAIAASQKEKYDLVFLDLKMPTISGIDTFKRLKEVHPDLPIVIVTGSIDTSTAQEVYGLDAFDIVEKPFKVADLKMVVRKFLIQHRNQAMLRDAGGGA